LWGIYRQGDPQSSATVLDSRTLQSTPESGHRAGYDGAKRKKGSKIHMAVDTLGHLLALHVAPADEQDRSRVKQLAKQVQEVTDKSVELAFVDQGYTGQQPADDAKKQKIQLEVVKLPQAKHGFVLLPRRWVRDIRNLLKRTDSGTAEQQQFDFVEAHPLIRSLADYGKLVQTSFDNTVTTKPISPQPMSGLCPTQEVLLS
jgi:transposase